MIVKILAPAAGFTGVSYNTRKIDKNKGELMKTANFGSLQSLGQLKPKDYINYLTALSALNKHVRLPQFHAVISGRGRSYDKVTLTGIAESWLKEMGYGDQPYLIVYHKDTGNNHVHIVSSRVGRDGKKISSAYEHVRAQRNINKVLGYEMAMQYRFSTRAQFCMILESGGFPGTDPDEQQIRDKIEGYVPDKRHAAGIAALLRQHKHRPGFASFLKENYRIELIFHSAEGQKPYGYSIIDHGAKMVFKGSEVLPLKELMLTAGVPAGPAGKETGIQAEVAAAETPVYVPPVSIADDVDDQQIHGMGRRRQRKARTNTR
ncbi:relaxase/mobilization nuclease domain-containing protein [Mucilaginibacter sp. UR6-1]|uniref:relaxase/mobilization nuclease domain-containing protein n=1 Tax=Mucilaginibacter sp. UR6-1 TaxID=1435643 RepID=UPI001E392B56|nr:relaxase/mobilization nuclease domain-containing protein [Mucilaginibacter sp. UR6-1]MCC8407719.1 relaxase/mobilization nuclease domain-containing protein [Mucilaginibacter sp. UR6-1]